MDKTNQFREKVQAYRRPTGHSQQELADTLCIQRQVLARKLSDKSSAYFTHSEIKQIIKTLADWEAINRRSEALELLSLMDLPPTAFSMEEWEQPPLAKLEKDSAKATQPLPSLARLATTRVNPLRHNLPSHLTGLVGREWLINLATQRLLQNDVRLLTLVGPGGMGKTRLSIEIGYRLIEQFEQGICFVDLSSLTDPLQVPGRIAQILGLEVTNPNETSLIVEEYLLNRKLLLILDNFEQILPAAELVSQLLKVAPGLKALVTSRSVLQIYGESELGVPPLELPDLTNLPSPEDFKAIEQFEAVQLFVARAQAINPTFALNPTNFAEVAQLCVLLEGLPLSIELAAARVKLMALPFLRQRLSESKLGTLSKGGRNLPARQQTLRATLDWSYALLDSEAHQLFNRLGIFRGNFNLEAVAQICYSPGQTPSANLLDKLSSLVDQSLLKPIEGAKGDLRFAMLETMREYAIQKLYETVDFETTQTRYQHYYTELLAELTTDFYIDPEDQGGLIEELEQDFDNFQAIQTLVEIPIEPEKETVNSRKNTRPVKVEGHILIARPLEEVFDYLSQAENWPIWNSLIKECRPLEPGPARVGKAYFAVSSILGRRLEQRVVITEFVPNQLFEIRAVSNSLQVTHHLYFSQEAGQTRLTFTTTNGIGQIFRFTHLVLSRIIRKGIEIQLNRLKTLLEKQP